MRFWLLIRTWIIGILLAGAAIFFGYQSFQVWSAHGRLGVDKTVRNRPKPGADRRGAYRRKLPYNAYEMIVQKNLFSSDRREKLPETSPTRSSAQPPKSLDSRFALFGIVITGSEKRALVSNFNKKTIAEKEYIWVKVGDKIGNLNVAEIEAEQVIITEGDYAYTLRLSDQNYPQKSSITRQAIKKTVTSPKNIERPKIRSPAAKESKASS